MPALGPSTQQAYTACSLLVIQHNRHTRNIDSLLKRIETLSKLHQLDISMCDVTDIGLQALGKLPSLRILLLEHNCRVTDIGIASLSTLTSLESLDVTGCNGLEGATLGSLSGLPIRCFRYILMQSIRRQGARVKNFIGRRATALAAVGRSALPGIAALSTLETLFLDLNPTLTDEGFAMVTARLHRLAALTVFGCRELTDRCILRRPHQCSPVALCAGHGNSIAFSTHVPHLRMSAASAAASRPYASWRHSTFRRARTSPEPR